MSSLLRAFDERALALSLFGVPSVDVFLAGGLAMGERRIRMLSHSIHDSVDHRFIPMSFFLDHLESPYSARLGCILAQFATRPLHRGR